MNILQKLTTLAAPLTEAQKKYTDKKLANNQAPHHSFSDKAMGGANNHRTEITLKPHEVIAPKHIIHTLGKHGYTEVHYGKGLVKDKYGREVKIGKVLAKHSEHDTLKKYEQDQQRSHKDHDNHKIVISRHPHDIANMSTNQGWTSCMRLPGDHYLDAKGGECHKHLAEDIQQGTHVAYLVHKDDHDLNNPKARIALKPFVSETGHKILRPETNTYGTSNSNFHKTVTAWAKKHFPAKDAIYKKNKYLYNDDRKSKIRGKDFAKKYQTDEEFANRHHSLATKKEINNKIYNIKDSEKLIDLMDQARHKIDKPILNHVLTHIENNENNRTKLHRIFNDDKPELHDHVVEHYRKLTGKLPGKAPLDKAYDRVDWFRLHTKAEQKAIDKKMQKHKVNLFHRDLNKILTRKD